MRKLFDFLRVVTINSSALANSWFGQKVLDIKELYGKDLEFEVAIN